MAAMVMAPFNAFGSINEVQVAEPVARELGARRHHRGRVHLLDDRGR
jgi:hypothetical protein